MDSLGLIMQYDVPIIYERHNKWHTQMFSKHITQKTDDYLEMKVLLYFLSYFVKINFYCSTEVNTKSVHQNRY